MEVPDNLREYWIEEAREQQRMTDESPEPTEEDMDELPNWACYYINRMEAERDEAREVIREMYDECVANYRSREAAWWRGRCPWLAADELTQEAQDMGLYDKPKGGE